MNSYLLLIILIISGCSTSKKVSNELIEKDKSTTKIEQKIEEQKDVTSLLNVDTTVNSDIFISIIEKETTTIDTAGNIKTERNKQTNISNKREQKGLTNNKVEDKSKNKVKTALNQKNDVVKEATVTKSIKTKANLSWLYWVIISIIAIVVVYFSKGWIWKLVKKMLRL